MARTTDFAANFRPVDWLITHPSEVGFTTDTKAVIIILKITILEFKKKNKKIEKQELKPSVISVSPRSSAYGGLSPRVNVRTDVNACECARGCMDTVRESALKVDSGRKIPCRTGESNLRQLHR